MLNEGLYDEYLKVKSTLKPSEFYKMKNKTYKKQAKFVTDYFKKLDNEQIIELINLYVSKHGKTHKENQLTLKEIINY